MGRMWSKFLLLMWKNALIQYRHPVKTALELLIPLLLILLLVFLRMYMAPKKHGAVQSTPFCPAKFPFVCDEFPTTTFAGFIRSAGGDTAYLHQFDLIYSPGGNAAIDNAMGLFKPLFKNVDSLANEKGLEEQFITKGSLTSTFAGIVFADELKDGAQIPDDTEIKIRFPGELRVKDDDKKKDQKKDDWSTNAMYPLLLQGGPREPKKNFGATPEYYMEGFLALQTLLTYFLIFGQLGATKLDADDFKKTASNAQGHLPPTIKMQRFPHADYVEDSILTLLSIMLFLLLLCGFYVTFIRTVAVITTEKENQLKETMKIMGLPNWLHWTAWFVRAFITIFLCMIIIVILLKMPCVSNYSVVNHTNGGVLLLFLFLYTCSMITLCFAVSVFFAKASTANFAAGLIWVLTALPFIVLFAANISLAPKMLACLFNNTAMGLGLQVMSKFEGTGAGIQWNSIFRTSTPEDNLTMGHVMLMLIIDTFIYLFIALYVEAVFPGEFGMPQPWNYLFTSTYWRGRPNSATVRDSSTPNPTNNPENFEEEPDLQAGVKISNLRKVYGQNAAVRNLSLNMYKDQITVLLGHNGAGKTTTMLMLTGMFPPTSGTAVIEGHNIITDIDGARSSMGLCPQHNILFDELTVKEHLKFFARLKGLNEREVKREVELYIDLLELVPKKNVKSSKLSGGMKRKLCVGTAMCGNSKVVMLDEPTAGMDPSARRAIWEFIQKQKKGRTILLSTHFMDEADLLGDRIAIMAGGELQCCGSSFFLKKRFGAGYRLIIDKTPQCDPDNVTRLLRSYIPSLEIQSNVGSELTYLLTEDRSSVFEPMLRDLENHSANLGIRSYGISLTTMEDVFMKAGADHGQEESYNKAQGSSEKKSIIKKLHRTKNSEEKIVESTSKPTDTKLPMDDQNIQLMTGFKLIQNQYAAMFMKRCLIMKRAWIMHLIQFLLPIIGIIICFAGSKTARDIGDLPALPLSLAPYDKPITLIESTADAKTTEIYDIYTGIVESSGKEIEKVDSITDAVMKYTEEIPSVVRMRYIVGTSFKGLDQTEGAGASLSATITAWFNNDPLHSPPLALSMALNSIYKYMLKKTIRFVHHPLPFTSETKVKRLKKDAQLGGSLGRQLGFFMPIFSALFVLFYIRERVSKSKHLQLVSGAKVYVFWTAAFLCDFAFLLVIFVAIIITLACFQEGGFKTTSDLGRVFLMLIYFGMAVLPMVYLFSFLFKLPATGFTYTSLIFLITGYMSLDFLGILSPSIRNIVHKVLLIDPHYSLVTGIQNSYITYSTNKMCLDYVDACIQQSGFGEGKCSDLACTQQDVCCTKEPDYFKQESPGIGMNILFSFGTAIILFLLLLMVEYKMVDRLSIGAKSPVPVQDEDSDVAEEKRMIKETDEKQLQRDYMIVLREVTKYYNKFLAVNGVSLAIKNYECFGLLGVNGAGKTTTFQILTGDARMSKGDAWINGYNVNTQLSKVRRSVGYCPQFDALLDNLTPKETLVMFALIRGIPRRECDNLVETLASDFDFQKHLNKRVKQLSGGNKRKVSAAVSTVGDPSVICLDEPTTGMDPATKRYLWNALCQIRDNGKCIVLTSHSMEECEALCTRLVIMVKGNFKCLGSVQHLKNKFAAGYTLTIKIKKKLDGVSDTEQVENFVRSQFPSAILREKHQELLTYHITDTSISWSRMFGVLENARRSLNIEDYSLGQSSLEQVFLSFTNPQN